MEESRFSAVKILEQEANEFGQDLAAKVRHT